MKTIGFFRNRSSYGPCRDFPPSLIDNLLKNSNCSILIEKGYGSCLDFRYNVSPSNRLAIVNSDEIIKQSDTLVSLTTQSDAVLKKLKSEQEVVSMFHFDTHLERNKNIEELGISAFSLDGIVDEEGNRLVHDFESTAANSVRETLIAYNKIHRNIFSSTEKKFVKIYVIIIGFGQLGSKVARSFAYCGQENLSTTHLPNKRNIIFKIIPLLSWHRVPTILNQLNDIDEIILVDVSRREKKCTPVVNLSHLSLTRNLRNILVLDVSADNYSSNSTKGLAGIPTGNESKWFFHPTDIEWETQVPLKYQVPLEKRPYALSHYAWPSCNNIIDLKISMERYAKRIYPFLILLANSKINEYENWYSNPEWSSSYQLWSASFAKWKKLEKNRTKRKLVA